ncbi:MAG: flagellar motor switch protein FliN [Planctomycetaceae bacterium]
MSGPDQPVSATENDASGSVTSPAGEIEKRLDDAEAAVSQAQLDELLDNAVAPAKSPIADPVPFQLSDLQNVPSDQPPHSLDLLSDVELDLRIELGRTQMRLEEVLHLRGGSVVALDKLAGDPVDIYVNGRLIAHGEVLVMNDNFCIRVTELVGASHMPAT